MPKLPGTAQRKLLRAGLCLVLCLVLSGCKKTYEAEVARGPAEATKNPVVVLLPVTCHSSNDDCRDEYADAVRAHLTSELEFAGYSVIDAEKLVREARQREDQSGALWMYRAKVLEAKTRRQVGSIFEDLPPAARRELLAEARATGLVSGAIQIFAKADNGNDLVEVRFRHARAGDDATVWVARCKHESYWNEKFAWSIEQAAKCALSGALGR
jgi:hypothetical protein